MFVDEKQEIEINNKLPQVVYTQEKRFKSGLTFKFSVPF